MKTYRYWQLLEESAPGPDGQVFRLRAWGGSDVDDVDALAVATARLLQMQENVARAGLSPAQAYEYGTGVVREELLAVVAGSEADPDAVVTRNRYGAPVLNARRLFIADVDFGEAPKAKFWGKAPDPQVDALARVREWSARNASVALRVYRTPAGLRLIRTDAAMEAADDAAQRLLADLASDPLYRALCRRQECFRARLGPKPWRIGMLPPPATFPREGAAQRQFDGWLEQYEQAAKAHAACALLETVGHGAIDAGLDALVAAHDERSGALSGRPLA